MISINDIVWSEENDNEKIESVIPINCMMYNCAYHPKIVLEKSTVGGCPTNMVSIFLGMNGSLLCQVL